MMNCPFGGVAWLFSVTVGSPGPGTNISAIEFWRQRKRQKINPEKVFVRESKILLQAYVFAYLFIFSRT